MRRSSFPRRGIAPALLIGLALVPTPGFGRDDLRERPENAENEARWDPPITGAYLGVRGKIERGALVVSQIVRGGAAERGGLRRRDAILAVEGVGDFDDVEAFRAAIGELGPDGPVTFRLRRAGEELDVSLRLDSGAFRDYFAVLGHVERSGFLRQSPRGAAAIEAMRGVDDPRLRRAERWSQAYEILNESIGRLGLSHSAVLPPWSYRALFLAARTRKRVHRLGLLLETRSVDGQARSFVLRVLNGAPGDRAGLRVGDEIVQVNRIPVIATPRRTLAGYESKSPLHVLQVEAGETVVLDVRRRPDVAIESVSVAVDVPVSEFEASVASLRRFERAGRVIASIRLWSFLDPGLPDAMKRALTSGPTGSAEAWVIDLRGRGGRVDVLDRLRRLVEADPRPRVLLIDRHTRSAKEVFAHLLKGKERVVIVGGKTAGAVLPALTLDLARGAALMYPGNPRSLRRILGEIELEGKGVEPDIAVEWDIPYSEGVDPVFERGVIEALRMLEDVPRRRRF